MLDVEPKITVHCFVDPTPEGWLGDLLQLVVLRGWWWENVEGRYLGEVEAESHGCSIASPSPEENCNY